MTATAARKRPLRLPDRAASTEARAAEHGYTDIELAAVHLRRMLDALMAARRSSEQKRVFSV